MTPPAFQRRRQAYGAASPAGTMAADAPPVVMAHVEQCAPPPAFQPPPEPPHLGPARLGNDATTLPPLAPAPGRRLHRRK